MFGSEKEGKGRGLSPKQEKVIAKSVRDIKKEEREMTAKSAGEETNVKGRKREE